MAVPEGRVAASQAVGGVIILSRTEQLNLELPFLRLREGDRSPCFDGAVFQHLSTFCGTCSRTKVVMHVPLSMIEKWKMEGEFGVIPATKVSYHRRMRNMIAEATHAPTTDTRSFMGKCGLAILRIDILILDAKQTPYYN